MADLRENCIEWLNGDDTITVTLSQKKYITKVEKLAVKWPELVTICDRNADGSIVAHLPLKALKLSIISTENRDFSNAFGRGENND